LTVGARKMRSVAALVVCCVAVIQLSARAVAALAV
jgi:hypothetical protein